MKKKIIIIAAAVVALVLALVGGFAIFGKDKAPEKKLSIAVEKDNMYVSDNVINTYADSPDRYRKTLLEAYGISKTHVDSFFEAPENWLSFDILINITNDGTEDVAIRGFEIANNGKNDMYACSGIGGEMTLSPGASYPVNANILCENGDLTLDEAKTLVNDLKIKLLYSKVPTDFDDGTQSEEEIFKIEVN